jgi:hypothetical protein
MTCLHSSRDGRAAAHALADVAPAKLSLRHLTFVISMHRPVAETAIRQIQARSKVSVFPRQAQRTEHKDGGGACRYPISSNEACSLVLPLSARPSASAPAHPPRPELAGASAGTRTWSSNTGAGVGGAPCQAEARPHAVLCMRAALPRPPARATSKRSKKPAPVR